jgi:hypothetical protein
MDEATIDLIQRAIDGDTSVSENAEVERIISGSQEARHFFQTMGALSRQLDDLPAIDPPPTLKNEVMTELRQRKGSVVALNPLRGKRHRILAFVWAAAAAIIVVALLQPSLFQGRKRAGALAPSSAGATMARLDVDSWPVVARVTGRQGGRTVTMTIRRNGHEYALEPELLPAADSEFSVQWNVSKMEYVDSPAKEADAVAGSATFHDGGNEPPVLLLRAIPGAWGAAEVTVTMEGKEVLKTSIALE